MILENSFSQFLEIEPEFCLRLFRNASWELGHIYTIRDHKTSVSNLSKLFCQDDHTIECGSRYTHQVRVSSVSERTLVY